MDDHTSRKQIDELAELYLTGVIDRPDATGPAKADSPIQGPAPIRLAPKIASAPASNAADPDDRHPMLRLTDTALDEVSADDTTLHQVATTTTTTTTTQSTFEADDEPAPQAIVEAVLLGNLPGMSGPWLTQYAQLIAQSEGPVALLHITESAIDLELVEPRAEAEPSPVATTTAVRIPPMRGNRSGLVGLLDALTRSETSPTRTILVRMDAASDAITLSRFAALHDWTLLCGSDDASVAGAAQQIRQFVRADPRLADRSVGLMVMGSDESAASDAANRIASELQGELSSRVQFIGHLKRMQPVQVREIGSFADPIAVWPQLVAWFDTLQAPEFQPVAFDEPAAPPAPTPQRLAPQPPAAPVAPRLSPAAASLLTPAAPASRPEPRPSFTPTPPPTPAPAPRTPRQVAQRSEPKPQPSPKPQPQQQPQPQPRATTPTPAPRPEPQPKLQRSASTARATEPTRPVPPPRVLMPALELDLVALLAQGTAALDDPATLEARIPDQPDTQLAVDANGVVHILLKKVSGTDSTGDDAASTDPRQAVMQLIEASRWVREHLELLALTQRDRTFIDAQPVLHLLTDRADLATSLIGKLAGQVRLHLLQQVRLGRETGWFCTPLG